jgi:molybdopterin-guanine dinucleotide biosynthesis protein B
MVCVFQVFGKKDSGKTTAIEIAIKKLVEKGYYVAAIKHSHHIINSKNKDTMKFEKAGARIVIFHSNDCALFFECTNNDYISLIPADVILIEGFKNVNIGKKFEIKSVDEAEYIANQIVEEAKECKMEIKMEVNGKLAERSFQNLAIFNLLRSLKVKEVKIID